MTGNLQKEQISGHTLYLFHFGEKLKRTWPGPCKLTPNLQISLLLARFFFFMSTHSDCEQLPFFKHHVSHKLYENIINILEEGTCATETLFLNTFCMIDVFSLKSQCP